MHLIADRLYHDNQDYHETVELLIEGNKALFFATTRRVIGILKVESREAIVNMLAITITRWTECCSLQPVRRTASTKLR